MFISTRHKWGFIDIPKTAGTSIKKALLPWADDQVRFDGEKVTDVNGFKPHKPLEKLGEFDPLVAINRTMFIFTVVRDPWDWHASIYRFFHQPGRSAAHITGRSFSHYIEALDGNYGAPARYRKEFREWCWDVNGVKIPDYIIRFENLEQGFKEVCKQIGATPTPELPHYKNSGSFRSRGRSLYMDNPGTKEIVERLHRNDIEIFGYEF